MSGGFFRGTSADQDTRFSNKQAKLLKSQKFAPELDHLVDMSKVKMDVMRPWIANRVTELIGFEDEVLINFIYSLLDGKEVNGKEVQISLTGFMERNTGKFMKELWALLLSAQKNASGVPQQFLDAKEEETKKKKAELDRVANEIKRRKEREIEEMDVGNDMSKGADTVGEPSRESRGRSAEEEPKGKSGPRGRSLVTKSPHSADRSSSPRRMRSRSSSKSFSNSRSYSNERRISRSLSASPKRRTRSSSPERIHRSSPKRSLTPRRRHSPRRSLTPPRRRSSYSRRRFSPSPTRYRMRSPRRRRSRSPSRRRSRSPIRRRSRSPIRRSRSPIRHRSRSPIRRSYARYRSKSPVRRRSPSPGRRRLPSPRRHRSPSPMRQRYRGSPLSPQPTSPSPIRHRSPLSSLRRSPSPDKSRSRSSHDWSSPSPAKHRSPLPSWRRSPRRRSSSVESPRPRKRDFEKDSPVRHASPRSGALKRSKSLERRSCSNSLDRETPRRAKALSPSPRMSSPVSEDERKNSNDDARSNGGPRSSMDKSNIKISNAYSPPRKSRDYKPSHSSEKSADDKHIDYHRVDEKSNYRSKSASKASDQHKDSGDTDDRDELSRRRLSGGHPVQTHSRTGRIDSNEKLDPNSDQHNDALPRLSGKVDLKKQNSFEGSGSEESDKKRSKVKGKRKNKRPEKQRSESEDESSYDSYEEERKEAKRRRKEERRSRKEEKRRRREERRRKKEEKRAEKLKLKSVDTVYSASDAEGNRDYYSDDDQHSRRRQSLRRNVEQTEPEEKKLEIELREKALENLRAKKNIH